MSAAPTFFNFAYGSNMLTRRLWARAPSARPVTVARLPGHELRWHKASHDGSGKCDVVPAAAPRAAVLGVVYEIPIGEKAALDKAEGLGHGYAERQVLLETDVGQILAWIYYATSIDPSAVPYTWYKALVVAGAREHSLPEAYVNALEAVPAKADSNAERAAMNFLIANAG
jgi:gamma-glutamylcyclotransferase